MELIVDAAVSAVDGVTDTDTGGFAVRDARAIGGGWNLLGYGVLTEVVSR